MLDGFVLGIVKGCPSPKTSLLFQFVRKVNYLLSICKYFGEIFAETVIWVIKKQPCGVQGCLISSVKIDYLMRTLWAEMLPLASATTTMFTPLRAAASISLVFWALATNVPTIE